MTHGITSLNIGLCQGIIPTDISYYKIEMDTGVFSGADIVQLDIM